MMFSRRKFICGATATSLVIPSFLGMLSAKASAATDTILVILNLQGGNDGYGMIFPLTTASYGNYLSLRPTFLPPNISTFDTTIEKAGTGFDPKASTPSSHASEFAMHTSLGALSGGQGNLRNLYGAGKVAFISGVGIPPSAPARTDHYTAAFYQATGQLNGDPTPGWGSKIVDQLGNPRMSIIGLNGVGTVIGQSKTPPLAINTVDGYGYSNWHDGGGPATAQGTPAYAEAYFGATPTAATASELSRNLANEALSFIDTVQAYGQASKAPGYRTTMFDPAQNQMRASGMKSQLMQAARLIIAGSPGRVYYAASEGFDTHGGQVTTQTSLLAEVSESIAEFLNYLAQYGKSQNVVVMTTSDFGRRPYENGNSGTDHGTSSVSIIAGDRINGGFYGQYPNFTKTDQTVIDSNGNFVVKVDFRAQLSQVIKLFGVDPAEIIPEYNASDVDSSLYQSSQEAVANLIK